VTVKYDTQLDNRYVGLEDIRLFSSGGKLLYNANRGLEVGMSIENGEIDLNTGDTESMLLDMANKREIEKNWVLFENADNKVKCIYGWSPLTIGDIAVNGVFYETHKIKMPKLFKNLRGSTNGVTVGNEVWFLCHSVSYEDRRYYYHMFVALDKVSHRLTRFSDFFTFEKQKVEYTLGFIQKDADNFLIGYSIMDRQTKFASIKTSWIEWAMNNRVAAAPL
jgi:hypothetical protein